MIFPSLTLETVVQLEDKFRLDASLSFISGGTAEVITDVLIQPEASESFISVFNTDSDKWYLDWAYTIAEPKTVVCKVITDLDVVGRTRSYAVEAISAEDDVLFSNDADLYPFESDLKNYLPKGKNTFLYVHRKAQEKIIAHLDENRIWKNGGERYTKEDIAAIALTSPEIKEQFNMWSTYETLLTLFESFQVSGDDIFEGKKVKYEAMRNKSRQRASLKLDADNNGVLDEKIYDMVSIKMVRR